MLRVVQVFKKLKLLSAKQVIDTTEAGDLWAAGFLHGWAQKMELLECAKIGSILGAAAVEAKWKFTATGSLGINPT